MILDDDKFFAETFNSSPCNVIKGLLPRKKYLKSLSIEIDCGSTIPF